MIMPDDQPLFDSVHAALAFALNANDVDMPQPFMNKAMAAFKVKTKKAKEAAALLGEEIKRMNLNPRRTFRGMEKAAQAGFILKQLEKLAPEQSTVLTGLLTHSYDPCSCRAPCCSGRRANSRWSAAVTKICAILKDDADLAKVPGKKGFGTQPHLRIILVEDFFLKTERPIADLARQSQLSRITVSIHHGLIRDYLDQAENEAWLQIAPILDQAGIVGAFT
jgi:hypothetical protein